jgi:DNA polymerase-3 subunit alpha
MKYIPQFIARKQGKEKIEYDLQEMEEYLQETYGVTVYQEQVMLLSQKLASFTKARQIPFAKQWGKNSEMCSIK